ncbi:MAG: hypothetical protein ABI355_18805 [Solirubrobacteraceae bacterium]
MRSISGLLLTAVVLVSVLAGCGADERRHRRPGLPATTTSATSLASTPPISPPAQSAPTTALYGINVNRLFNDGTYTPAQVNGQLSDVAATGVRVARSDAFWEASEPRPPVHGVHTYSWTFDDTIAGDLAAHGLTWLPIIDYTATWNQSVAGEDHSPPASDADYAAYAAAFARRYGPGGAFWAAHPELAAHPVSTVEIWNEPDNRQFWLPTPDAGAYTRLYVTARAAIAAAVPTTRVLIGGLTQPTTTLPAMVAADSGLAGQADGVAVHPYGTPLQMIGKLRDDRQTLTALGMGSVPLYVTEFGWVIHPQRALGYVPASRRPGYIRSSLAALGHLDCGLVAVVYYTWITPEHNRTDREDWFGIQPPDGRPGPDRHAFADGLHAAQAPGASLSVCGSG